MSVWLNKDSHLIRITVQKYYFYPPYFRNNLYNEKHSKNFNIIFFFYAVAQPVDLFCLH